ncbi:hypothetical protein QC761_512930 [Podospora bellae-mahoneyi]|uniref:ATP-dependent DNA helicase n=1 Tax=Podospora bellae-mahoneyi TaxID=2093777 RepID=A0ABR0FCH8_9PEZI|nr:hypothetical protein QC761_512930 [Podospora bellae-mahoneyi]
MSRKLKSSLSVAVKGWSVERYQICGDQQHGLSRGRHGVLRVQDKPSNDFRIYRPTTTTGLQIKCRVISPGFFNAIIYSKDAREPGSSKRPFTTNAKRAHQLDGELDEQAGPTLLPEQQDVVNHAVAGHNIFFTGPAGCGKSTVLREVRKRLEERMTVCVMAPTGIVALAIHGTTTWSFAGWTPNSTRIPLEDLPRRDPMTSLRLSKVNVIIIDEISMIENNFFERLDFLLRHIESSDSGRRAKPFGGIQVIITGDFCQLPPIKPFQHCFNCGRELRKPKEGIDSTVDEPLSTRCKPCGLTFREEDKFAFSSAAWSHCNFVNIHLKAIHRQKDPAFISLLQKCRLGIPFSNHDITALTRPKPTLSQDNAVKLFPVRADVWETNHKAFEELETPPIIFKCHDGFAGSWEHSLEYGKRLDDGTLQFLDQHRFDRKLRLKKGMRVLLLASLGSDLRNGSQGTLVGYEPFRSWTKLPTWNTGTIRGEHAEVREKLVREFASMHKRQLKQRGFGWPIVAFDNGMTKTIYPECDIHLVGYESPYSTVSRTQIPLTAGYALTIHKAQGMTLDKVIVDVSKVFVDKQIYVALSRARSLEGLQVIGLTRESVGFDDGEDSEKVRKFLRDSFGDEVVKY